MQDLEGFKFYLAQRRGKGKTKPQTRALYVQQLLMLFREVPTLGPEPIMRFFNSLLAKGRNPSYINKLIVTLHLYGEYKGISHLRAIRFLDEEPPIKTTLSDKEIEDFLALPDSPKMRMFWECLAFSGCRPGEISTLTTASVLIGQGVFSVDGKTGPRLVPIAPNITEDLVAYIKTLKTDLLFPGSTGKPISREAWRQSFNKRIDLLGIKRPGLSAHSMRHSFASRMISEINVFSLKRILGHKRLETTEQYVHLNNSQLIKDIKKDPLSRASLPFYERFKRFREGVTELLESLALTPEEEKQMLEGVS